MPPKEITKINDTVWELPVSYKAGMKVPARIFATEELLNQMDDAVFNQLTNVACLPGIQKYAYCMADGHSGYGFPIGGVAAFDPETGIISPGGIGYDINCISGKSKILTQNGVKAIKKFEEENEAVATLTKNKITFTKPAAFMKFRKSSAFRVETETGNKIIATGDHPFLTKIGMKKLEKIRLGEFVKVYDEDKEKFYYDTLTKKASIDFDDFVYDFNLPKTHNFIANNIVVSNCGMRLINTNLTLKDVQPKIKELVDTLYKLVPAGVGGKSTLHLTKPQLNEVMENGVNWCIENNMGWKQDKERIEESGCISGGDSSKISERAMSRGFSQLGTLGSGNHYLEIQVAHDENIFDTEIAKKLGITQKDQILVMVHCGSRGFGHQVGTDYLELFESVMRKYSIHVPDRELACAPFQSKEGQDYFKAMVCAANLAFTNRQVIMHKIREGFSQVFKQSAENLGMELVYDVCHNIAKLEEYKIDGKKKTLLVHRKGATRAFGPGRKELGSRFKETGQPVIIGGSMETGSYLLVGQDKSDDETFGSTCHGAGRTMSRAQAKRTWRGEKLQSDMEKKGIYVKAVSMPGLAEEAGDAYKNVDHVVDAMAKAGITKPVVALKPLGNVKG
ncbi:RtcB family protein [Candidatus Woesearchaeota archaeon]|nr:RtcB family protein [Candidatus Woesearchaeota archaeon]